MSALQAEFAATVERHWAQVTRVAWCLLDDRDLTVDVVTATFLAPYRRMAFILRFVEKLPDGEAAGMLRVRPEELRRRSGRLTAAIAVNAVRRSGSRRLRPERRRAWHVA